MLGEGSVKCLGVLYDLDYSGKAQLEASRLQLQTILRIVTRKRASPETIVAVLASSTTNKLAYQGVLSNWSLSQCMELDKLFAKEHRKRSKNMAMSQEEQLFQPASQGGMGFSRLSQTIQERKLGLIDRVMRGDDDQTRWAVEMVVARGAGGTCVTLGLWLRMWRRVACG